MPDSAEALLVDAEVGWMAKDFKRAKDAYSAVAGAKQLPAEMRSEAYNEAVTALAADLTPVRTFMWRYAMNK